MGLVYSNAVVTITAAVSATATEAFGRRGRRKSHGFKLYPTSGKSVRTKFQREFLGDSHEASEYAHSSEWSKAFLGNPLLARGWTLQE